MTMRPTHALVVSHADYERTRRVVAADWALSALVEVRPHHALEPGEGYFIDLVRFGPGILDQLDVGLAGR